MRSLICIIFLLSNAVYCQTPVVSISKNNLFETISFKSEILNENRILNIYLPNEYFKDSTRKFPVIYLLDGSLDEDFIHIAGLVQFCSFSWINEIEPSIVVGISNVDRQRDFTYPTTLELDKTKFPNTGKSSNFIQAIEHEIIPVIDIQYRTSDKKSLIGQSLGGLLATEILVNHAELFNNYYIISPSLWWDNESILNQSFKTLPSDKTIFLAVGKEGKMMKAPAKKLASKIKKSNASNCNLLFKYYSDKNHGDMLHQAIYDAFRLMKE